MAELKKIALSMQQLFLLIVVVAVVFFAFLNLDPVTIDLFFTTVTTSIALLLLVPLAAGMLLGWLGGRLRGRNKERSKLGTGPAELPAGDEAVKDVDWENLDLDKIEV